LIGLKVQTIFKWLQHKSYETTFYNEADIGNSSYSAGKWCPKRKQRSDIQSRWGSECTVHHYDKDCCPWGMEDRCTASHALRPTTL